MKIVGEFCYNTAKSFDLGLRFPLSLIHICTVVVEYPQDWLVDALEKETEETKTWRSVPALSGRGAAIGDIGSHMENWVHFVTGLRVKKVLANLEAVGKGTMLDNNFQVIVKYDNGASGFFWGSQVAIGYDNAFKVMLLGEKGSIEFWQENNNYLILRLRNQPMQEMCIRDRRRLAGRGCGKRD